MWFLTIYRRVVRVIVQTRACQGSCSAYLAVYMLQCADYISVQELLMVPLVYVLVLLITCCYARYSETAGRPLLVTLFTAAYSLLHTFDYA